MIGIFELMKSDNIITIIDIAFLPLLVVTIPNIIAKFQNRNHISIGIIANNDYNT